MAQWFLWETTSQCAQHMGLALVTRTPQNMPPHISHRGWNNPNFWNCVFCLEFRILNDPNCPTPSPDHFAVLLPWQFGWHSAVQRFSNFKSWVGCTPKAGSHKTYMSTHPTRRHSSISAFIEAHILTSFISNMLILWEEISNFQSLIKCIQLEKDVLHNVGHNFANLFLADY